MPDPSIPASELDPAERFVVLQVLNQDAFAGRFYEAASLLPALLLVGFGLHHDSAAAIVAAFTIVATFRAWALLHERRTAPVLKSALRKLVARADPAGIGLAP